MHDDRISRGGIFVIRDFSWTYIFTGILSPEHDTAKAIEADRTQSLL